MTKEELIRLRKDKLKMTQQELADSLNVTFATVNRWENGRDIPEEAQKLLECVSELVDNANQSQSKYNMNEIKEAIKHTGIMGVVCAALVCGALSPILMVGVISKFKWLSGIVGAGIGGWSMLPYFKKLRNRESQQDNED